VQKLPDNRDLYAAGQRDGPQGIIVGRGARDAAKGVISQVSALPFSKSRADSFPACKKNSFPSRPSTRIRRFLTNASLRAWTRNIIRVLKAARRETSGHPQLRPFQSRPIPAIPDFPITGRLLDKSVTDGANLAASVNQGARHRNRSPLTLIKIVPSALSKRDRQVQCALARAMLNPLTIDEQPQASTEHRKASVKTVFLGN